MKTQKKSLINIIGSILAALFIGALVLSFARSCKKDEPYIDPIEPPKTTYTITYKYYALSKEIEDIPPLMFKSDANYPTSYVAGEETKIDDLGIWKQSSRVSYEFEGWFFEPMCSEESAFDGVITADMTGDIVIYAKVAIWVG